MSSEPRRCWKRVFDLGEVVEVVHKGSCWLLVADILGLEPNYDYPSYWVGSRYDTP